MNLVDAAVGPYERVVWATDAATGLRAAIAVHSTALGPAVGGTRFHRYPDDAAAVIDALRLAEGMTLKAAAAGLDLGGGKGVVIGDPGRDKTPELLRAYAEVIESLGGTYRTAEDVGTTAADMDLLREHTRYVLGLSPERGGGGDPSPYTARGVVASMREAWRAETGSPDLAGARVLVQGAGQVGSGVARLAAAEGAALALSDVAAGPVAALARELGAATVAPEAALGTPCDILAPCALGGVLSPSSVPLLRCRVVAGAANNQLTGDRVADLLARRGIAYVPDFIANAGGLIAIADELDGFDAARVTARVEGIAATVAALFAEAGAERITTLRAARRRAARRLEAAALLRHVA